MNFLQKLEALLIEEEMLMSMVKFMETLLTLPPGTMPIDVRFMIMDEPKPK